MAGDAPTFDDGGLTYYTVAQVAKQLRCSEATVRAMVRAKRWPHKRFGPRIIRFTDAHLAQIAGEAEVSVETPDKEKPRSIKEMVSRLG